MISMSFLRPGRAYTRQIIDCERNYAIYKGFLAFGPSHENVVFSGSPSRGSKG